MGKGLNLGESVPDFTAESSRGTLRWHAWLNGEWAMLCSHPAVLGCAVEGGKAGWLASDFTPVCTTELGTLSSLAPEFKKRGVKIAALSCQDKDSHLEWIKDIEATEWSEGNQVDYPIIADPSREIATAYGMLDPDDKWEGMPTTCRAVFIIGPDKTLKLSLLYPATTGRNFAEVLRAIDSLQLTALHKVATPVNWTTGSKCMVVPNLTDDVAKDLFGKPGTPEGFKKVAVPSGKNYIRLTDDPASPAPNKLQRMLGSAARSLPPALSSGILSAIVGVFVGIKL